MGSRRRTSLVYYKATLVDSSRTRVAHFRDLQLYLEFREMTLDLNLEVIELNLEVTDLTFDLPCRSIT